MTTTQEEAGYYRDGTSQKKRGLAALSPESVSVEERDSKYWLTFIQSYTRLLNFYDVNNTIAGDWSGLLAGFTADELIAFTQDPQQFLQHLPNAESFCQPHVLLLLTFLHLLRYPQQQFKQLTQRHLDFYYQQVLQLRPRSGEPDRVYLTFQLSPGKKQHGLKQGTLLDAGKDPSGAALYYALDEDTDLSTVQISAIKTLSIDYDPSQNVIKGIYPRTVYDQAAQKILPPQGFPLFGAAHADEDTEADQLSQHLGLAIASPLLHLESGDRAITLTLSCLAGGLYQHKVKLGKLIEDKAPFSVYLSGLDLPLTPEITLTDLRFNTASKPEEEVDIESASALLTAHKYGTKLAYPAKLTAEQVEANQGKLLICPKSLSKTEVTAKQIYLVEQDQDSGQCCLIYLGEIDIAGSFMGTARLYSPEAIYYDFIFKLNVSAVHASITTHHPANHFNITEDYPTLALLLRPEAIDADKKKHSYYHIFNSLQIINSTLEVSASGIKNFVIANDTYSLNPQKPFALFGQQPTIGSSFYITHPEFCEKNLTELTLQFDWVECPKDFTAYYEHYKNAVSMTKDSFLTKLIRVNEGKQDKLGKSVPLFNAAHIGERALESSSLTFDLRGPTAIATDKSRAITSNNPLDYPTYYKIELQQMDFQHQDYPRYLMEVSLENAIAIKDGQKEKLITLNPPYTPMVKQVTLDYKAAVQWTVPQSFTGKLAHITPFGWTPVAQDKNYQLLAEFNQSGYLFLGLDNISIPQNVSLLFKTDAKQAGDTVTWHYLADNHWHELRAGHQLIEDGTSGLYNTGIIKFHLTQPSTNNTLLPGDKYWLRATVKGFNSSKSQCYTIQTNAASATFVQREDQPTRKAAILAPGSIKGLVKYNPHIKSITQLDHSFLGRLPEKSHMFYTRVSERLRHKQRALTIVDYEHMVLAQFPEVYKVKCLPLQGKSAKPADVQITLVIIPRGEYSTGPTPLQPEAPAWLLQQIKAYIEKYVSPFVTVKVKNPEYQVVRCFVYPVLNTPEQSDYQAEIEQAIITYLSPWRDATQADIPFCSRIYASSLIQHIESYPYVEYVTDLKFNSDDRFFVEVQQPDAILVSDTTHEIEFYPKEK
jgi:hypothetical protein